MWLSWPALAGHLQDVPSAERQFIEQGYLVLEAASHAYEKGHALYKKLSAIEEVVYVRFGRI